MSTGVFFLDEDKDRVSPPLEEASRPSPPPADDSAQPRRTSASSQTSVTSPVSSPTTSTVTSPSAHPLRHAGPQISGAGASGSSSSSTSNPGLLAPQPLPLIQALPSSLQSRKHAASFAATPSFPSPLAQAMTVPLNSDNSSSSSHSDQSSSDDDGNGQGARTISGRGSSSASASGTPRRKAAILARPRTVSPSAEQALSGGSTGHHSGSPSPTSSHKSSHSRPPSPLGSAAAGIAAGGAARSQVLTPGALLMKSRRSASGAAGSTLGSSLPTMASAPSLRESPPKAGGATSLSPLSATANQGSSAQAAPRRLETLARGAEMPIRGHARGRSGSSSSSAGAAAYGSSSAAGPSSVSSSSPLAFGSPELFAADSEPEPVPLQARRSRRAGSISSSPVRRLSHSMSGSSGSRGDANILGLGWGSGWETSSTSSGAGSYPSSPGGLSIGIGGAAGGSGSLKGKGKDSSALSSGLSVGSLGSQGGGPLGPPSPRRDRDPNMRNPGVASPPRQRRPSEFLNPGKMPLVPGSRASFAASSGMANLSTSASMISPLNPLPSPWTTSSTPPFSADSGGSGSLSSSSSAHAGLPANHDMTPSGAPSGTGSSGAIRLNRVPTSVKLATDLIKTGSHANLAMTASGQATSGTAMSQSTSPGGVQPSPSSGATVPTPNPSPILTGMTTPVDLSKSTPLPLNSGSTAGESRTLGVTSSAPSIGSAQKLTLPSALEIGKGRPTLSVPATPVPTRNVSTVEPISSPETDTDRPHGIAIPSGRLLSPPPAAAGDGGSETVKVPTSSTLATPVVPTNKSAMLPPPVPPMSHAQRQIQRPRPSLPSDLPASGSTSSLSSALSPDLPTTKQSHKFRTSMHEPLARPVFGSDSAEAAISPRTINRIDTGVSGTSASAGPSPTTRMPLSNSAGLQTSKLGSEAVPLPQGLGLNMPPTAAREETFAAPRQRTSNPEQVPGLSGMTGDMSSGTRSLATSPGGGITVAPSAAASGRVAPDRLLQLDLAGIGSSLGDAASHASMIMQSRQAKLQRWRPSSSGNVNASGDAPLPPAIRRSTTTGAPMALSSLGPSRAGQWAPHDASSPRSQNDAVSPGEDLPPIPSNMGDYVNAKSVQAGGAQGSHVMGVPPPPGGMAMERTASAGVTVGGIEWVDWYDCYKRYKSEKMRADAAERARVSSGQGPPPGGAAGPSAMPPLTSLSTSSLPLSSTQHSPKEETAPQSRAFSPIVEMDDHVNEVDLSHLDPEATSAIALTPTTSRDELNLIHGPGGPGAVGLGLGAGGSLKRRSMSIRSTLSAMDPRLSPTHRRQSLLERPRQSSGSSIKSTDTAGSSSAYGHFVAGSGSGPYGGAGGGSSSGRKKKNLVAKMEGWWNAVKSNFIPEGGPHPAGGPGGMAQHRLPHRPSNLGPNVVTQRIPSAPATRRGSVTQSPIAPDRSTMPPPAALPAKFSQLSLGEVAKPSVQPPPNTEEPGAISLDDSVATLPALPETPSETPAVTTALPASAEGLLAPPSPTSALAMHRAPSTVSEESSVQPSRSSLDSRRRQPGLRLDLQPPVFGRTESDQTHRTDSSGDNGGSDHSRRPRAPVHRFSDSTSRSSSFSQPMYGPGLTPGLARWDHTPSPIFAVSSARDVNDERPVAPGADITIASVRRHVKHRLDAAKENCDAKLRETIRQITAFAEQAKEDDVEELGAEHMEIMETLETMESVATSDERHRTDYFEGVDSPLLDADSEAEGGDIVDFDLSRSRNVSTSRGPSRRASISRPTAGSLTSSPSRRLSMLPNSPRRSRRRPSIAPRSYINKDRVARNLSLSMDRNVSAASSRSTSRSHSPMPGPRFLLPSAQPGHAHEAAEADRKFLATLQELILTATDVLETSVRALLSRPGQCGEIVQKLQKIGSTWDEHEDWPGRSWYVDVLMAVAGLSRLLDWWEAEKGFWNFDDEAENEPILFVMKPVTNDRSDHASAPGGGDYFRIAPGSFERSPLRMSLQVEPDQGTSQAGVAAAPAAPVTGALLDVPTPHAPSPATAKIPTVPTVGPSPTGETPKAQAAEDLRFMAEHAKSVNIVMELGLQGDEVQYINDAIMEVTGREPEDVLGQPITDILAPADATTFTEATQKLLEDDNNTVQLRVRFEVLDAGTDDDKRQPGPVYIELEGVGMLMREDNEPSHTMWVLRPVLATQADNLDESFFPRDGNISTEGILCRICEREIVTWFFEKHNETCDAVHRLEGEISECNDCLRDLQQTVAKLQAEIDDATEPAQYQGVLFFTLPDSVATGIDQVEHSPQGVEVRKLVETHLGEVEEILSLARQIETPSVRDDEADLPFLVQRYLDPESEEKLARIMQWRKPATTDRALALLFTHVEEQLRRKQKCVARMQSTIRYSEKTRHEWEDKVNQILADQEDSQSQSEGGSASGEDSPPPVSAAIPDQGGQADAAPEHSPPGHRKIAPQARLPITQGHPQRSATVPSVSATPLPTDTETPTPALSAPKPSLSMPPPSLALPSREPSPLSPLMVPVERLGHARRPSSSRPGGRDIGPLSPRIPSAALQARAAQPSIKDFEIIKPISRGAFGSVYLAKKVATGDYFAIKALKKSDMIAKNQITNVKAERTILMNQGSSPYVVKLFFSFQSKEYLYLVMEYLNGGDCATLIKTLGGLPEEWARNYIAEVVLGLEYLHARNIVHRDIKPDNLLIDARGHLKLTDFGLSRIGLLNRQVGGPRPAYLRGTSLRGSTRQRQPAGNRASSISSADSPLLSPEQQHITPGVTPSLLGQSYFPAIPDAGSADESSDAESAGVFPHRMRTDSATTKLSSNADTPSASGREPPRFVGTPDYLAPESILGIGTDDRVVDWWALGVVLYEFLYGIPPFHDETPAKVFDNVVSRRINWHEDEIEISAEARDLMDQLMCSDPARRLGARGADEVKKHAFFTGIDWATITTSEASFVPEVTDPESTDYFDPRGAAHGFHDDEGGGVQQVMKAQKPSIADTSASQSMSAVVDDIANHEDFGGFNFKNVPVLKQANDDMIRKLRVDSMAPIGQTLEGAAVLKERNRSLSNKVRRRPKRKTSDIGSAGPPSPTTSTSSAASTPSRTSVQPTTPSAMPSAMPQLVPQHFRRPSELNALDRVKSVDEADSGRRASAPSRIRAGSGSSISDRSTSMELWRQRRQVSLGVDGAATAMGMTSAPAGGGSGSYSSAPGTAGLGSSFGSALGLGHPPPLDSPAIQLSSGVGTDRALDVLIAEDNPISQKILETLLTRMGCRCVCVEDGPNALAATMGSIRFDVIICDIHMPVVNGEQVARMIRSTNNQNQNTPIIACTSYEKDQITEEGTLFSAVLSKPVVKTDLSRCLQKLGFVLTTNTTSSASDTLASSSLSVT